MCDIRNGRLYGYNWSEDEIWNPASHLKPGTEEYILRQHGRICGRTQTVVLIQADGPLLFIIPTIFEGLPLARLIEVDGHFQAEDRPELTIARVWWNNKTQLHHCDVIEPNNPIRITTYHSSIKSAVRHARKVVAVTAPKPPQGWTKKVKLAEITSPYASADEIHEHLCWISDMEAELEEEMNPRPRHADGRLMTEAEIEYEKECENYDYNRRYAYDY